jgi:predicted HTH transcriptional regulator
MGEVKHNIITIGISGKLGKDLVSKIINGKTFHTKYPDRSQVKYTQEQLKIKMIFRDAAKFAADIVNDPVKKAAYKKKKGYTVYHTALADYMALHRPEKRSPSKKNIAAMLNHPDLNERQKKAIKYLSKRRNMSNAIYQKLTVVSKPTATRDLQTLVKLKIFSPPATKGAGALYTLLA